MTDPEKVYHLSPTNDTKEHSKCVYSAVGGIYCPCKCDPEVKEIEDALVFIHNSFDGREGVEAVNKLLKHKL